MALIAALAWQLTRMRYVAAAYWLTVVLVSVVGTLITDNLTDGLGVPLLLSTPVFAVLLAIVFSVWWREEHTLSIKEITNRRREGFYWLAILTTFALGTAAGDLVGEQLALGYGTSMALFAAVILVITVAWRLGLDTVLAFWLAYIMTRPLGASLGDLLSQSRGSGGLGIGTTATSAVFLAAILALVVYLSVTRIDVMEQADDERELESAR